MRYTAILIALLSTCSRYTLAVDGAPEEEGPDTIKPLEENQQPERVPGGVDESGTSYDRPNPVLKGEIDYYLDIGAEEGYERAYYYVDHDKAEVVLLWSVDEPNRAGHITYREDAGLDDHDYENAKGITCNDGGSCWYNPEDDPDGTIPQERLEEVTEGLRNRRLTDAMDEASYRDLIDYAQPTVVLITRRAERETVATMFNQALRHAKDLYQQTSKIYTIIQIDNRLSLDKEAFSRDLRIVKGPVVEGYSDPQIVAESFRRIRRRWQPSQPQFTNSRVPLIVPRSSSDSSFGPLSGNIPKGSLHPLYERYNLIDGTLGSFNGPYSGGLLPRSTDQYLRRSAIAVITKQESNAITGKGNTNYTSAQTEIYLKAWEATQDRITTAIWPFLVAITNGSNCSLVYDVALSIWADITIADVDVIGPFSHGLTSLPSKQRFNGSVSTKNSTSDYAFAVSSILRDLYQYAWYNSVQAANKTGDLQYLLEIGAAIRSYPTVKDNSTSTMASDLSWFTTYNHNEVPQKLS